MRAERGQRGTVVVTGGNTGGHVIPNLPVIARLRQAGWSVHYVGDPQGLEARLIPGAGVPFHGLASGKLRRYASLRNATDVLRTLVAVLCALWLLARLRPRLVYSKGGFVAVPVMLAAWLLRIPVVAHESDRTLSLTGRIARRIAVRICCGLPPSEPSATLVYTGIPLREDLAAGRGARVRTALGLNEHPVLLAVGGSLGAAGIDQALAEALPGLLRTFQVIHLTPQGTPVTSAAPAGYHPMPNDYDGFPDLLAAADVVLSRAGATTIAELTAVRKPALLIPLPRAASRGEQIANGRFFQQSGCGECLEQEEVTPEALERILCRLLDEGDRYREAMSRAQVPDATAAVLQVIDETLMNARPQPPVRA